MISLGLALLLTIIAYAFSFRRCFVRMPELADVGPLPRGRRFRFLPIVLDATILRDPKQRACYHFISRTLLRSDTHLQIVLAFAALSLVVAAQTVNVAYHPGFSFTAH